jgi:hypothetical protein
MNVLAVCVLKIENDWDERDSVDVMDGIYCMLDDGRFIYLFECYLGVGCKILSLL